MPTNNTHTQARNDWRLMGDQLFSAAKIATNKEPTHTNPVRRGHAIGVVSGKAQQHRLFGEGEQRNERNN